MKVVNNLARIAALSVVLASTLGSAAPTPSPEMTVANIDTAKLLGDVAAFGPHGLFSTILKAVTYVQSRKVQYGS
jgi:hypothetical protein